MGAAESTIDLTLLVKAEMAPPSILTRHPPSAPRAQKMTSSLSLSPNKSCESASSAAALVLSSSAADFLSLSILSKSSAAASLCFFPDTFFRR